MGQSGFRDEAPLCTTLDDILAVIATFNCSHGKVWMNRRELEDFFGELKDKRSPGWSKGIAALIGEACDPVVLEASFQRVMGQFSYKVEADDYWYIEPRDIEEVKLYQRQLSQRTQKALEKIAFLYKVYLKKIGQFSRP
jgi:hypothetical protein